MSFESIINPMIFATYDLRLLGTICLTESLFRAISVRVQVQVLSLKSNKIEYIYTHSDIVKQQIHTLVILEMSTNSLWYTYTTKDICWKWWAITEKHYVKHATLKSCVLQNSSPSRILSCVLVICSPRHVVIHWNKTHRFVYKKKV